jgi:hypothetical protein
MSDNREHRIRARAHAIWESQGQPHGADREHWDQAAKEIDAEEGTMDGAVAEKPARAAKPAKAKAAAAPKPAKVPAAKKPAKTKAI